MKSLEQIFQIMEMNQAPFWTLQIQDGRRWVNAGSYLKGVAGNPTGDDAAASSKRKTNVDMQDSQDLLEKNCAILDNGNSIFAIEMGASPNSHGNGKLGPYQFTINGDMPAIAQTQQQVQQLMQPPIGYGLGGIPGLGLPNLGDILGLDRQQGTLSLQMQLLEADKERLRQREDDLERTYRAKMADVKEAAQDAKARAIEDGKAVVERERMLFEIEKQTFAATKQHWEQIQEANGSMSKKARDVFEVIADIVHKKLFGPEAAAQETAQLAGADAEDEHWALCEGIAQELYTLGQPGLTKEVQLFIQKMVAAATKKEEDPA